MNAKKIFRVGNLSKFCLYLQKILRFMTPNNTKKRLVTSFNNLTAEQQEAVKELYPRGFAEVMTRIDKPNGDFFYVVPYETDEISYLVKIDVKIDEVGDDGIDDDFFGDEDLKGAEDIQEEANQLADDDME